MHWSEKLLRDPVGAVLLENFKAPRFIISPTEFHRADFNPRLAWHSVKFAKAAQGSIPQEPGLYAFVVRIPFDGLPPHGWVLYIGQTGDGASGADLRSRYGQYLRYQRVSKRAMVFLMLNLWDGHLEFFFTPQPSRKADLVTMETQLLGAFRPPFTDRTYPASYMSPRHAF